jgi:Spy/CpxP family protein refolding chaperone
MNRLHLTAAMAALALAIVGLSAQGQDRDNPKSDRRPDAEPSAQFGPPKTVLDRLELTQDQQKRIAGLIKDFSEKHKGDLGKAREEMDKLRKEEAAKSGRGDRESLEKRRKQMEEISGLMRKGDVEKAREEMRKLREEGFKSGRGDRDALEKLRKQMEDVTAKMRKLEDELDDQITGQLNNDQKKKFEEAKKELTRGPGDRPGGDRPGGDRPKGDQPKGDRPGGDRPARPDVGKDARDNMARMMLMMPGMSERLGLSAEQKEKLAKIRKEYDEKMMDVLTPEQKKQLEGRFPGRRPGGPGGRDRDKDKDGKDKDKKSREF